MFNCAWGRSAHRHVINSAQERKNGVWQTELMVGP